MSSVRLAALVELGGAEDRLLETLHSVDTQRGATLELLGFAGDDVDRVLSRWAAFERGEFSCYRTARDAAEQTRADYLVLLTAGELLAANAGRVAIAAAESGAEVIVGRQASFHPDGKSAIGVHREPSEATGLNRSIFVHRDLLSDIVGQSPAPRSASELVTAVYDAASHRVEVDAVLVVRRRDGAGGDEDRTRRLLSDLHREPRAATVDIEEVRARLARWSLGAVSEQDAASVGSALRSVLGRVESPVSSHLRALSDLLERADVDGARILLDTRRVPGNDPGAQLRAMSAIIHHSPDSDAAEDAAIRLLRGIELTGADDARSWDALAEAVVARNPGRAPQIPGIGSSRTRVDRGMTVRKTGASRGRIDLVLACTGDWALPVLFDTISSKTIRPRGIVIDDQETRSGAGKPVSFALRDLPVGHPLVMAAVDTLGIVTGVPFRGTPPRYDPLRSALIDDDGGALVVTRRRHWIVRAPRSLLRRIIRRGRG